MLRNDASNGLPDFSNFDPPGPDEDDRRRGPVRNDVNVSLTVLQRLEQRWGRAAAGMFVESVRPPYVRDQGQDVQ